MRGDKKITYNINFTSNVDSLMKQMQSSLSKLKLDFGGSNSKGMSYVNDLEKGLKTFANNYKDMIKTISQPGTSSKQIKSVLGGFESELKAAQQQVNSFKTSMRNSFSSKTNQDSIEGLANLTRELNKLKKAANDINNLKTSRAGLLQQASSVTGKRTSSSDLDAMLKRYNRLTKQKNDGNKVNSRDASWLANMAPKIEELAKIQKQIDAIDEALSKKISKAGLQKGTKEEIATAMSDINNNIQKVQSGIISPDEFKESTINATSLLEVLKEIIGAYQTMETAAAESLNDQDNNMKALEDASRSFKEVLGEFGIVFSAGWVVRELKQLATASFDFYKSLDKALTDIAIVSNLSRKQVQGLTDDFIHLSRQTGMAIDDIAQASVIFFQQGLGKEEVLEMTEVTAQFAKVAGITVADAADKLTAAVNGYRVGVEGAIDVADKFNAVAAKSAASINELSTAFEKGASQANQAGISMDNYLGYLATMIEVTREAPENIGTSMKTIMARFQQVKEAGTSEDGDTDVNAVEKALKSVGIALRDDNNQLRDLEEVLQELGPKWNSLDRNTQAYLGTVIAGTRQQSRFISLMQNWDRALELAKVSQDSAGMQTLMHAKAMDSLDASIQKLVNSWQKFLATLTNSDMFIGVLNTLTKIMDTLSDDGARTILVVGALAAVVIKLKDKIVNLGSALMAQGGKWKNNIKDIKNSTLAFKDNIKALKDYAKYAKATKNVKKIEGKIDTEQGKIDTAEAKLATTDDVQVQAQLRQEIEASKQAIAGYKVELQAAKEAQQQYATSAATATEAQKQMAMQSVATTATLATGILGIVVAIVGAFDALDSSIGQAVIGITAALAAIAIAFQVADKAIKATGIGALISYIIQIAALAITAITALVKSISSEFGKGKKALEDCNEAVGDLAEGFEALNVGLRAAESLLKRYDELSNKIARTAAEQEELNDLIQQMADAADLDVLTDRYGNKIINREEYEQYLKDQRQEKEDQKDKIVEAQQKMTKKTAKTGFWESAGISVLSSLTGPFAPITSSYLFGKSAEKHLKEAKENLKKHFDEYKDMYMSFMGDLNDTINQNTLDDNGQILASSNTKRTFQNAIKNRAQEAVQSDMEDMSKEELEKFDYGSALEKKYENYKKKYGKYLEEMFIETDKLGKETTDKTYGEMEEKVEAYLKKFQEKTGATKKDMKAMREAMYDSMYEGSQLNVRQAMEDLDSRIKDTQHKWDWGLGDRDELNEKLIILKDMQDVIRQMKPDTASKLDNFGLFDAGNEEIFAALKDQMSGIEAAFAISGEDGVRALYDAIQEGIDNGTIKGDKLIEQAREIQEKAFKSLEYSASISWGDLAKELDDASDKLRTLNNLSKSLAENGGWTLDEFTDLASVLDSIDITKLDPASLNKYTAALDNLNLSFDASEGLITAQGDAVKSLQDIQEAATKAQIAQTIDKLKVKNAELTAEIAFYDAEISANQAAIDYLTDSAQTEVTLSKAKSLANVQYEKNQEGVDAALAVTYDHMAEGSAQWASQTIDGVAAVGEAFNKLLTGQFTNIGQLKNEVAKARKKITWQGGAALDSLGYDEAEVLTQEQRNNAAAALGKYNAGLSKTKASLESQKKNIQAEMVLLEKLYNSDLSNLGSGKSSGGGDKNKIETYIGQLKEIYNILNRIQVLEHRLSTLDTYADISVGKQYGSLLKERLDLNEELLNQYDFLVSEQKKFTNGYKDFIGTVDGLEGVFDFDKYGQIIINWEKYTQLQDQAADGEVTLKQKADDVYETYTAMFEELQGDFDKYIQYLKAVIDLQQEMIDSYVDMESKAADAVKEIYQKILDTKLDAIDQEKEAIEELRKAREQDRKDQENAKAVSNLQTNLQRAMMDTSGASDIAFIKAQNDINDKLEDIAEDKYSKMLDDITQQLEDEKEALQEEFDQLWENMDWLFGWLDEEVMRDEERLTELLTQTEEWNTSSELQRAQLAQEWDTNFQKYMAELEKGGTIMDVWNSMNANRERIGQLDNSLVTTMSKESQEIIQTIKSWQKDVNSTINSAVSSAVSAATSSYHSGSTGNYGNTDTSALDNGNKNGGTNTGSTTPPPAFSKGEKLRSKESWGLVEAFKPEGNKMVLKDHAIAVGNGFEVTVGKTKYYNGQWYYEDTEGPQKGFWFKGLQLRRYALGGLVGTTGPAWLDGTTQHPEAVLNALQTEHFIKFTNALDNIYGNGNPTTNNSSVNIENISFNVDSMSSAEDGEEAFNMFVNKFKEIGNQTGIKINTFKNTL